MKTTKQTIAASVVASVLVKSLLLSSVLLTCVLLTSCTEGPSGVNPGHELEVTYDNGILKGIKLTKRAEVMVSGDSVVMQTLPMLSDTVISGAILFDVPASGVGVNSADMAIKFPVLPLSPGTLVWTAATASASGGATVSNGFILTIEGITFYGISGSTVITEVRKDGNGRISGYSGYMNGTMKSVWPKGFVRPQGGGVPPGFDITNPSFIGEELTLHSCPFNTRSNSSVAVIAPID